MPDYLDNDAPSASEYGDKSRPNVALKSPRLGKDGGGGGEDWAAQWPFSSVV